jgi:hypothetical protein
MRRQTIGLRGHPWSITLSARQMIDIFADPTTLVDLGHHEILGLLYLASLFDNFDEDVLQCWEGRCRKPDDICDTTDRRSILALSRRVMNVRHGCPDPPIKALNEAQKTDIVITQIWLLNRVWHLAKSHNLLQANSEHPILTPSFALALSCAAAHFVRVIPAHSFELHGMGMFEKLSDMLGGVKASRDLIGETAVPNYMRSRSFEGALEQCMELWQRLGLPAIGLTGSEDVEEILRSALRRFRNGRHPYNSFDAG